MCLLSVKNTLDKNPRPNSFKDNFPGETWFKAFLRRHPSLSLKHAESLTRARAQVSQEAIESWFTEVLKTLKEDHMDDVLNHPERIFNEDETGFIMYPKSGKVLGPRKRRDFYKQVADNEKE